MNPSDPHAFQLSVWWIPVILAGMIAMPFIDKWYFDWIKSKMSYRTFLIVSLIGFLIPLTMVCLVVVGLVLEYPKR